MEACLLLLAVIVQIQNAKAHACLLIMVLLTVLLFLDKSVDVLEVQRWQALPLTARSLLQWQRGIRRMLPVTLSARAITAFGLVQLLQVR
jgi:hypothetical protein